MKQNRSLFLSMWALFKNVPCFFLQHTKKRNFIAIVLFGYKLFGVLENACIFIETTSKKQSKKSLFKISNPTIRFDNFSQG